MAQRQRRQSKLTKAMAQTLAIADAGGASQQALAGMVGVSVCTIKNWRKQGQADIEKGRTKTLAAKYILDRDRILAQNYARMLNFYNGNMDAPTSEGAEARKWLQYRSLMEARLKEAKLKQKVAQAELKNLNRRPNKTQFAVALTPVEEE